MAIICRDRGLLFVLAPHTGSTAIASLLVDQLGGDWLPPEEVRDAEGRLVLVQKHSTVPELMAAGLVTAEDRQGLLTFSAVRNPFDALASLYLKHRGKDQALLADPTSWVHGRPRKLDNLTYTRDHTFDQWIEHVHAPRLRDRLRGRKARLERWPYDRGIDAIMRYERLQDDFDGVLRRAGIDGSHQIPRENVTPTREGRDYREFYSERSRLLVESAYADFLVKYDYSF
jgi:hypothetical protein